MFKRHKLIPVVNSRIRKLESNECLISQKLIIGKLEPNNASRLIKSSE